MPAGPARRQVPFSIGRFGRLVRKELRETLRDRRTILTLVLMPILVYPLLGLTFQRFLLSQAVLGVTETPEYVLGFETEAEAVQFQPIFLEGNRLIEEAQNDDEAATAQFSSISPETGDDPISAPQLIENGMADVALRIREFDQQRQSVNLELFFDPRSPKSAAARRELQLRIQAFTQSLLQKELAEADRPSAPPITVRETLLKSQPGTGLLIAAIVPLVLVLMTVTGAVYPAIDLTAGERERGTLESVIAAPIASSIILTAKYIAVFTVAMLTAGVNLLAMTATAFAVGLDRLLFGSGLTVGVVIAVIGLLVVLAAFFSAVLLLITSFARSFKEAQAYLIPLMLASLAPGIVSLMPHLELNLPLAITPLVGIVLLARDMLSGSVSLPLALLCILSTLFYAFIALFAASKAFGADVVMYGSAGTWSELWKRRREEAATPSPAAGLLTPLLIFPAFLLLSSLLGRVQDLQITTRLLFSAIATFVLFGIPPAVVAYVTHANFRTTFRLFQPSPWAWLAAGVWGLCLWPFAFELLMYFGSQFEQLAKKFESVREPLTTAPLPVLWLTLAIIPAVCEEWLFRGLVLSSLRSRISKPLAVIISSLLFGAFHVVMQGTLLPERFLSSTFLGLFLGTLCVLSGSLWPGVLMHALNNGLLLSAAAKPELLERFGIGTQQESHLPTPFLIAAGIGVLIGGGLLKLAARRRGTTEPVSLEESSLSGKPSPERPQV